MSIIASILCDKRDVALYAVWHLDIYLYLFKERGLGLNHTRAFFTKK